MRKVFIRSSFIGFYLLASACQTSSSVKPTPNSVGIAAEDPLTPPAEVSKLTELPCDQLIEKSKDVAFALKNLAGIRAHKLCKNFRYDFQQLSDLEKRLYAEEVDELDPNSKKPATVGSLSLTELKNNLNNALKPDDKFKAYKHLRTKLKVVGQRNEFLKTTADLFNWTKAEWKRDQKDDESTARFYEATQLLARTYWTEGRNAQADKILTDNLRLLKGLTSVAEIYYLKGRIAEEASEYAEAVSDYDLALEDIRMNSPKTVSFTTDKMMWLKSWILYKTKQWDQAEKSFADFALSTNDNGERSRALFFQARCLNQLDKKVEARLVQEKIMKDDFFSFYGLVTYNEIGMKLPALSQLIYEKKFPFDPDLSFLPETDRKIFTELIRYKEINIAEKAVPILSKAKLDKQVNLSLYLADKGQRYLPLFASFAKLENNDRMEVLLKYADLVFPQPYRDNVKKMSEKTQLPTSLIYSIMKQESAFNEKTRSSANALGLMQMIPPLAKTLSKKFSVDYNRPDDLYKPAINIQLGSFELMEQVRKQSGQLTYVAAAYNAGPNALAGWLRTRKRADIVEFIEDIPYDETRTYVKIIARNKLFYERISNRDEPQAFPIEFLTTPIIE